MLARLLGLLTFLWGALFLRHRHATALGQFLNGFDEIHAGVFHQKTDGIAVFAAAKAMKKLFAGADSEGGGLLGVKRAQTRKIGARFFQRDIATHHVDHIDTGEQVLKETLWNGHGGERPIV